jgi:hypothetical protein
MRRLYSALLLAALVAAPASAGDVLWFTGHSGLDEGHTNIQALLEAEGAVFDVVGSGSLPTLDAYTLIFICMPGFLDPTDYFSAGEKAALGTWLALGSHRVVLLGDWDGWYGGQAVMEDLLAAIGNPIVYEPGAYDEGCDHCSGALGAPDPLTSGLSHVCYGLTATWDPAVGVPLAYPEDPSAPGPYIVSNGTDIPCIVGIGDSNVTTDLCDGHIGAAGDEDSKEFHRRLYHITCSGEEQHVCCFDEDCLLLTEADCLATGGEYHPEYSSCTPNPCVGYTPAEPSTWGTIKSIFR